MLYRHEDDDLIAPHHHYKAGGIKVARDGHQGGMGHVPVKDCSAYLAGPMRGIPFWNFPAFEHAATALRKEGWTIDRKSVV